MAAHCYESGATHFLDLSDENTDLEQALNFAYRYVEHIRGGTEATQHFNALLAQTEEDWVFSKSQASQSWVSDALRKRLPDVDFDKHPGSGIYRQLTSKERARVRGAMGRLRDGSPQAAVALNLGGENIIHHLHASKDQIFGRIERNIKGEGGDDWTDRDLLSGLRKATAARAWIREKLEDGEKLGLITLGLKNFRTINAAYGRMTGDQILRLIGQRLLTETAEIPNSKCLVARIDGQNYLIGNVLEGSRDKFVELAEKLIETISVPAVVDGRKIQLIPRVGIAFDLHNTDETTLIRRASLALAEAIASDASPVVVSGTSEKDVVLEQQLEEQLVQAMDRGEITIALQPQMNVNTGQLVGAEALARWDHPEFGLLGAATLFAVAERAGLMDHLSVHIHKLALSVGANWPESLSFLRLSINITAGDLAKRNFVKKMMDEIVFSGFSSDRLTLEIIETELIVDMAGSVERLAKLRENGLCIAIDDFGTGYSSLSYLKELPLDYLKIDSGLTGNIDGSKKEQVVVRSIIDMAGSLGLKVVAEGVETEVQLELLAEQGCEFFQGFLRSGPLSPEEFVIFALRSN